MDVFKITDDDDDDDDDVPPYIFCIFVLQTYFIYGCFLHHGHGRRLDIWKHLLGGLQEG